MSNTDKNFPNGPWTFEPDFDSWIDQETGYKCVVYRQGHFGHWCGYVEIPEGHVLHGVEYSQSGIEKLEGVKSRVLSGPVEKRSPMQLVLLVGSSMNEIDVGSLIDVHGGVTYSGKDYWNDTPTGFYWGFDCNHYMDLAPLNIELDWQSPDQTYRDIEYVKAECRSMAKQLSEIKEDNT